MEFQRRILPKVISSLPDEVLAEIFSHLDKPSKISARQVCKRWKYVLDTIFLLFHGILTDESLKVITRATVHWNTLRVHSFLKKLPPESDTSSGKLLAFGPERLIFQSLCKNSCRRTPPSVSFSNILKLLRHNPDVLCLTFEKNALVGAPREKIDKIYLPKLKCIEIALSDTLDKDEEESLLDIAKLKKPKLWALELRSKKDSLAFREKDNVLHYIKLFRFVAAHWSTIELLNLQIDLPLPSPDYEDLVQPYHECKYDRRWIEKLEAGFATSQQQLGELKIMLPAQEGSHPYTLGTSLLSHQNRLRFLEVTTTPDGCTEALVTHIVSCVQRNTSTLVHFAFRRQKMDGNTEELIPLFRALSKCSCLRDLHLFFHPIPDLPIKLPATVQCLSLIGDIGSNVLLRIRDYFPHLRQLKFANLSVVTDPFKADMIRNFQSMLQQMKMLREIKFYSDGFDAGQLGSEVTARRIHSNVNVLSFNLH